METEIKTSLPTKLVSLRKQKGLTQMELAEKLNVSRQAISRWEVGAAVPSTDNLKVLGDLYSVQIDYLLDDEFTELPESRSSQEDNLINQENILERTKHRPLVFFFVAAVIVVIVLICTLVPQTKGQNHNIPMEEMHTEHKEDYAEGTFGFE